MRRGLQLPRLVRRLPGAVQHPGRWLRIRRPAEEPPELVIDRSTLCVLGCADRRRTDVWPRPPRPRADGQLTCRQCTEKLRSTLTEVLELAVTIDLVTAAGSAARNQDGGRKRIKDEPVAPVPVSVPAAALTDVRSRRGTWVPDADVVDDRQRGSRRAALVKLVDASRRRQSSEPGDCRLRRAQRSGSRPRRPNCTRPASTSPQPPPSPTAAKEHRPARQRPRLRDRLPRPVDRPGAHRPPAARRRHLPRLHGRLRADPHRPPHAPLPRRDAAGLAAHRRLRPHHRVPPTRPHRDGCPTPPASSRSAAPATSPARTDKATSPPSTAAATATGPAAASATDSRSSPRSTCCRPTTNGSARRTGWPTTGAASASSAPSSAASTASRGPPRSALPNGTGAVDEGGTEVLCGQPLYASAYSDTIECPRCGREWSHREWRFLGRTMGVIA
jgi:hypothetical protein